MLLLLDDRFDPAEAVEVHAPVRHDDGVQHAFDGQQLDDRHALGRGAQAGQVELIGARRPLAARQPASLLHRALERGDPTLGARRAAPTAQDLLTLTSAGVAQLDERRRQLGVG